MLPSGFCFACAWSLPPYCAATKESNVDNMTAVLVVSQDAIMVLGLPAYQRGAARAAVCVASSLGLDGVWFYGRGSERCDILQGKHRRKTRAPDVVVRLFA